MKRLFVLAVVGLLSLRSAFAADPSEPLQGTWTVTQLERAGQKAPDGLLKAVKVVVKGNTIRMATGPKGEGGTFKLDDSKKPKAIDAVFMEGPKEDVKRTALGIYEIEGDQLKIVWRKDGGERPTKFASLKGERTSEMWVLKRAKKD